MLADHNCDRSKCLRLTCLVEPHGYVGHFILLRFDFLLPSSDQMYGTPSVVSIRWNLSASPRWKSAAASNGPKRVVSYFP
jgi:hypothetical protein